MGERHRRAGVVVTRLRRRVVAPCQANTEPPTHTTPSNGKERDYVSDNHSNTGNLRNSTVRAFALGLLAGAAITAGVALMAPHPNPAPCLPPHIEVR